MFVFSKFSISMGNACNIYRLYYQIHVLIMQDLQKLIIGKEGYMRIKSRCQTYYCSQTTHRLTLCKLHAIILWALCTYNPFQIPLQTKDKGICKGKVTLGAARPIHLTQPNRWL